MEKSDILFVAINILQGKEGAFYNSLIRLLIVGICLADLLNYGLPGGHRY
jgi:hypothetical protein